MTNTGDVMTAISAPRCLECKRPMRPATADPDHPRWAGATRVGARGLCTTCYGRTRPRTSASARAAGDGGERSNVVRLWPTAWTPLDDLTREEARDALCAQTDPEVFFPEKGGSSRAAKKVCAVCPIRRRCRNVALANPALEGIWGGTTTRERRRLRANTAAAAA
ncbi:transcription factor WhiB (plasmid) [Xylanimonas cellulosilytica DSM 15894]|uniref:Transcriptional regulator WhiB n=1 Tax=Xylanimonas cellulosilytica (strain DSM 15894 / JCM 12276 / CECT 5975 / KCTC 9989 / LMG 20990 / NBRC 107835 / XIL07) TaxID=446471 RepID=D1C0Z2_XYLCX|nr:WhiB family transcriptional regulator [Xylanimonas cellulosilytica]ACZ32458.1 transcription factor WhiB [Xylanimonas cellulosilytica DSM 15894]